MAYTEAHKKYVKSEKGQKKRQEWVDNNIEKRRAIALAYYYRHREDILEKERDKRAMNPKHTKNRHLLQRYGITLEDYVHLLTTQNESCAICGRTDINLHIDHDHNSNQVRGLLCGSCNRGLGLFGENVESLLEAIKYLRRYST